MLEQLVQAMRADPARRGEAKALLADYLRDHPEAAAEALALLVQHADELLGAMLHQKLALSVQRKTEYTSSGPVPTGWDLVVMWDGVTVASAQLRLHQ